ncbi:MAG TPA: hypothetical protein VF746_27375 [Longimicrobium sp.]|jgi:hypothetical protein
MRALTLVLTMLALQACASARVDPERARQADERAVYRVVIDSLFVHPGVSVLVLMDSTQVHEPGNVVPGFEAVIADMHAKSRTPVLLPTDLRASVPILWFTAAQRQEDYSTIGDVWERFYARYPGARGASGGFHYLSRVGFDAERRRAAVQTGTQCHYLCGHGNVVVLKRSPEGRWRIVGMAPTWVS